MPYLLFIVDSVWNVTSFHFAKTRWVNPGLPGKLPADVGLQARIWRRRQGSGRFTLLKKMWKFNTTVISGRQKMSLRRSRKKTSHYLYLNVLLCTQFNCVASVKLLTMLSFHLWGVNVEEKQTVCCTCAFVENIISKLKDKNNTGLTSPFPIFSELSEF